MKFNKALTFNIREKNAVTYISDSLLNRDFSGEQCRQRKLGHYTDQGLVCEFRSNVRYVAFDSRIPTCTLDARIHNNHGIIILQPTFSSYNYTGG